MINFVQDLSDVLTNGIHKDGVIYNVIHCFVCDAPARAYIRVTLGTSDVTNVRRKVNTLMERRHSHK